MRPTIVASLAALMLLLPGCLDESRLAFEESASEFGLDYVVADGLVKTQANAMLSLGAGIAVGDPNGDSLPDLYIIDRGTNALYIHDGQTYQDRTETWGAEDTGDGRSALFADVDNDGDQDLITANFQGFPRLHRNLGDRFETVEGAFPEESRFTTSLSAADVDNDGDLDIALGQYGGVAETFTTANNGFTNILFINDGTGRFTNGTVAAGLDSTRFTFVMSFNDMDMDGDPDIYECNDWGSDVIWENAGNGTFTDVTETLSIGGNRNCMGVTWTDVERDGDWDVFITNIFVPGTEVPSLQGNQLFSQNADGTFSSEQSAAGTADSGWGWGLLAFDADNDADDDLVVTNGFMSKPGIDSYYGAPVTLVPYDGGRPLNAGLQYYNEDYYIRFAGVIDGSARHGPMGGNQSEILYENVDGEYRKVESPAWNPGASDGRNVAVADVDGDGDLDLFQSAWAEPIRLFVNQADADDAIRIHLTGTESNRDAIGTRIIATVEGEPVLRERRAGSGFYSQSEGTIHIGLGDALSAAVEVHWPSGTTHSFDDVEAGTYLLNESDGTLTHHSAPYK